MPVIQAVNNNKNTFQNKNKKKRETPISHNKFTPNKFLHEWYVLESIFGTNATIGVSRQIYTEYLHWTINVTYSQGYDTDNVI